MSKGNGTPPVKKPRVGFCWECGRKLHGYHHVVLLVEGHERTLHKLCADFIKAGIRVPDDTERDR